MGAFGITFLPPFRFSPDPLLFEEEMESWILGTLGVPAWAGKVPALNGSEAALVYNLVAAGCYPRASGSSGLNWWLVQFDAYAARRSAAAALIESLRLALQDYRGMMGRAEVVNVLRRDQHHAFEPLPDGSGKNVRQRRMVEYTIWFRESPGP